MKKMGNFRANLCQTCEKFPNAMGYSGRLVGMENGHIMSYYCCYLLSHTLRDTKMRERFTGNVGHSSRKLALG